MAEVDREVDAVGAVDAEHRLVVLDVHGHQLVADFGRVLRRVGQTELGRFHFLVDVRVLRQVDLVALNALRPADVVQALPKEDHVRQHDAVVGRVRFLRHFVQVHCEGFVHHHRVARLFVNHHVAVEIVLPPALLPGQAVRFQPGGLERLQLVFSVVLLFIVLDCGLVLGLVLLLVLGLVLARELAQLLVQRVRLDRLPLVPALKDRVVELREGVQGVRWAAATLNRVEKLVGLGVRALIDLNLRWALTFFRGRPRPRPEVGGARCSPSGPWECFCLVCV